MPQVFVSHSSKDRDFVEQELVPLLEHHAVKTWYSRSAIRTAAQWEEEIRRGLAVSDWFLVILSAHTAESDWVKAEVSWALDKRRDRLIPVMIADCDPTDTHLQLARYQYVDFRSDVASARMQLLALWDQDLQADRTLKVRLEVTVRTDEAPDVNGIAGKIASREVLVVGGATIGRDPTAEIYLSDPSVSRRHAELKVRFQDGLKSLWLIDLAATFGLSLNGVRISEPVIVVAGDVISIGRVQIAVGSITG